ncbi:MAG TPA: transglycosylase SLT domain-containing protein [Chitinivibrionales bacterium]|jgi:membrane-bound lytic murein transglycosylase D|nr:transglycosylase SLT domain-containing protein [Chitinivibrionales bacterium]
MKTSFLTLIFLILVLITAAFSQTGDSAIFPVPDLLKDNVAFWKKVYTELSVSEGVLHDREYPLVIYKKIDLGQRSGFGQARYIESERLALAKKLDDVIARPESTLTDEEKVFSQVLKEHAPAAALAGAGERIRFQQGQKERFREGLQRSTGFIDTIRAIFAAHGIPPDLAYLPHVESSFNTEAYSKVGAAGLWQFMRGTGRLFLKINYLIDERRDPIAATAAAARLLRQNYDQLQSWPLAVTAYNHGVNGMKRAVEVAGSRDIAVVIARYSSPSFQFASKNFYACFLAASDIAKRPEAFFTDLHFAPRYEFRTLVLPSFMKPAVVCRYLNISQTTLMEYNPALRPVVFFQQKEIPSGFTIRIPSELRAPEAEKALAAVPDSLKSDAPERLQYYNVQKGDNLYTIAARMGVPVDRLALENRITRGGRIYAGQVLRVPSAAEAVEVAAAQPDTVAAEASQQGAMVPPAEPAPQPPVKKPSPQKPSRPQAAARETTAAPSASTAPPAPAREAVADSLRDAVMAKADTLPEFAAGTPAAAPAFDVSVYTLETTLSPSGTTAGIRVSVDETIGHYADWLGVPTYRIRALNRLGPRSEIRIGSALSIPVDADKLARFVKARLEYHMALEEDFYVRFKVTDVRQRTVKRGEALWTICSEPDQIPLWLFAKYNKNADLSTLMPGMRVRIPVIEEKTERDIELESGRAIGIYPPFEEPAGGGAGKQIQRVP